MPLRSLIHSSLVSITRASIALVTRFGGISRPLPTIRALGMNTAIVASRARLACEDRRRVAGRGRRARFRDRGDDAARAAARARGGGVLLSEGVHPGLNQGSRRVPPRVREVQGGR